MVKANTPLSPSEPARWMGRCPPISWTWPPPALLCWRWSGLCVRKPSLQFGRARQRLLTRNARNSPLFFGMPRSEPRTPSSGTPWPPRRNPRGSWTLTWGRPRWQIAPSWTSSSLLESVTPPWRWQRVGVGMLLRPSGWWRMRSAAWTALSFLVCPHLGILEKRWLPRKRGMALAVKFKILWC